jgi:trk system potassium uptake protein TrkA
VHVVIMGCGRVGASLAAAVERLGNSVAIVDKDPQAFRRLGTDFRGQQVVGGGFDRKVLVEAGIERAGAFAAVSSGDNSNIISARVAREMFGVDNVVARIYDPRRAEVYQRLGIPTVATVRWTADQILRRVLPDGAEPLWRDPTGTVVLAEVPYHPGWIGTRAKAVEQAAGARLAFVNRMGETVVPKDDTVIQEGDIMHLVAAENDMDRINKALSTPPSLEEH